MVRQLLALLLMAALPLSRAFADDPPNIPTSAWEQFPQGVAVAMFLTSGPKITAQKFEIFIKNTSNSDKYLVDFTPDPGYGIIYMDSRSHEVFLRPIPPLGASQSIKPSIVSLKPGEVLTKTYDLSASELATVRTHLVKYHFALSPRSSFDDYAIHHQILISSSPKMLTTLP